MLLLIVLIHLIFGFGYGGYRVGPGWGYYGGGGLSLILTIALISHNCADTAAAQSHLIDVMA
jgi:hypothetical protein